MTTARYVQRFRRAAGLAAAAAGLVVVTLVVVFLVILPLGDVATDLTLIVVALALCAAIGVAAIGSVRRAAAIRAVAASHPEGVVFLARRQPSLVSDLSVYLAARGIDADVADGWQVGLVDGRGISAWSSGARAAELLLMPWSELGAIGVTDLESGGTDRGVAVDVKPFETPLIVAIGYAAFGVTAAVGRAGVAEVVALTNGLRPAVVE